MSTTLIPLTETREGILHASAADSVWVSCSKYGSMSKWKDAVRDGWRAVVGKAFWYLCPQCTKSKTKEVQG